MKADRLKVLILGGYGTFGSRLAALLADEPRLTLVIAGRSRAAAERFCAELSARATVVPLAFDRDRAIEPQLCELAADVVVDASGPFQFYGPDCYRVVKAALALGIHYLDLADGSDFVGGIAQFDHAARSRGLFILVGASSFPVLTAAVIRALAHDMARLDSVVGGIAPSPHARVGRNVIRAIASYAGRQVPLRRDGRSAHGYGLLESRRHTVAPPGRIPLPPRRFSLVDVPDLRLLPQLWPSLQSVWLGAGPVPEIWHRALNALAFIVRLRLLPSLAPFAGPMHWTMNSLAFGEHRGGMFVAVAGAGSDGERIERSWHLVAEDDDGPLIPSMAAAAIIRRCLAGKVPPPGARPAATDLELADYDALFVGRRIATGYRQEVPASESAPLYRRILGEAWDLLPLPIRTMHNVSAVLTGDGRASIERGRGPLVSLVAWLMHFPPAGDDVPVTVTFRTRGQGEHWARAFDKATFASVQTPGRGRLEGLICERVGPFSVGLALVLEGARLRLVVRGWSFRGIPLPLAWAPRGDAYESAEDDRFNFHVEIGHPLLGLIVRYRGWLEPRA
jgi:hypothetical protein